MITDARHDSTANAYHTTVPCLSGRLELHIRLHHSNDIYSTKHILDICTKSRGDHLIAQTRKLECTRDVLPSVIDELGMIT